MNTMIMYGSCGHEIVLNSERDMIPHELELTTPAPPGRVVYYCFSCLDKYKKGLIPKDYSFISTTIDEPIIWAPMKEKITWWNPNNSEDFNPRNLDICAIVAEKRKITDNDSSKKIRCDIVAENVIMGMPTHWIKRDLKKVASKATRKYRKYIPKPQVELNLELTEIQIEV